MRKCGFAQVARVVVAAGLFSSLGACSSSGPLTVDIPGSAPTDAAATADAGSAVVTPYSRAFDAARDTLVARRFELDRIDARAGVITTRAKATAGAFTPWDREQSSLGSQLEDTIHQHQRRVTITFVPADGTERPKGVAPDMIAYTGPVRANVSVLIERVERPGFRAEVRSPRYSTSTVDEQREAMGEYPSFGAALSPDDDFAARIAADIRAAVSTSK